MRCCVISMIKTHLRTYSRVGRFCNRYRAIDFWTPFGIRNTTLFYDIAKKWKTSLRKLVNRVKYWFRNFCSMYPQTRYGGTGGWPMDDISGFCRQNWEYQLKKVKRLQTHHLLSDSQRYCTRTFFEISLQLGNEKSNVVGMCA